MTTTVINIKSRVKYDIYVGRSVQFQPKYIHSKWHNPFKEKDYGREKAIELFNEYILAPEQKYLLECLPELKNKILCCWCKPLACHGDVLAMLADELK